MKSFAVVALAVVVLGSLLALPRAEAAPPQPYNLYGIARDASTNPLLPPQRITAFIDGVDYSNGTSVYSPSGNYDMDVYGDWVTNTGMPNTPEVKEGGNLGDSIMVVAGDMTTPTTGQVFTVTRSWSPGDVVSQNIILSSPTTQPALLKIARIITRPVDAGPQYLYICNPTSRPVEASDYYLERDGPGTFNGPTHAIPGGSIPAGGLWYVNETTWVGGVAPNINGDNLKLVWTNNGSAFGTQNVVIDRVEFNATSAGTLYWEPGNTIMSNAAAPAVGRELRRTSTSTICDDTNNNAIDFADALETGRPSSNTPPTITVVSPNGGEDWTGGSTHNVVWNQADGQDATLSVTAEYSTDNQASWNVLYSSATEPNGLRTHPWTVPCVDTTVAWVRVRAFDGGGLPALDMSDAAFKIDCTRPALIGTNPTDGATGVSVTAPIILTFSETMNRATTQGAITVAPNTGGISYVWSMTTFVDDTVSIQHNAFSGNTLHTVTVSCAATDVSDPGNQLLSCPRSFTFRTVQTNVAPIVVLSSPVGGEIWSGGINHNILYTTTDPDDVSLVMDISYSTNGGASWLIIGTPTEAPGAHAVAWLTPTVDTSLARVRVCATDTANPQVCQASPSNFTIDSTRPTVVANSPTAANDVALTTPIVIRFSETMNRASVLSGPLFTNGTSGITYVWSQTTVVDDTLTINHGNLFSTCTDYAVWLGTGARDVSDPGNALAAPFTWTFGTVCAPTVAITTPAGGEVYSGNTAHDVVFRADDSDATATVWINISTDGGINWQPLVGPAQGTLRSTGVTLTVSGTMPNTDTQNARIRVTAQDSTRLDGAWTSSIFWIDAIAPTVSSSTPADAATGVDISAPFTIVFSEAMNEVGTVAAITLSPGTWTLTPTWSGNSRTLTLTHAALAVNTPYTISISAVAKDQSDPGNALAATAIDFTTGTAGGITADAGPDRSGEVGVSFTLDASGSTGAITNYTWSIQPPGGGAPDTRFGASATYTFNAVGTYTITLTVRDASGNTATDTASYAISARQGPDFLSQYWWLLLILIIAIVAALLFLLMGKRRKKEEPEEEPPARAARPPSKPAAPPPKAAAPAAAKPAGGSPTTVACPSCGTIVDATDTECFMCGTALK